MVHGMFIDKGLSDWQIVQHKNGSAKVDFCGTWILIKDAVKQGIDYVQPMIKVYNEADNSVVIDWTEASYTKEDDAYKGDWNVTLDIPAGGPYRIETGLFAKCVVEGLSWTFRGDACLHVGVGDLFVIAGQSNAAGYAKDTAYDMPEMGVNLYRNRGKWDIASHPMNEATFAADMPNAERGNSGVSPFLSFGKTLKSITGYPVGLIQTAMGGLSIKKWDSDKARMYMNMVDKAKECGDIAGVLWYQGCSDTYHDNCDEYKDKYYGMINRYREALGYDVPFFTFQLNRQINGINDPGWGLIRENQRMAAHDLNDVYVLPTTNAKLFDEIHNCAYSCMQIGQNMAKMCAHVLYGKEEFFAPEIKEAVLENQVLTLSFDNVKGGLTAPSCECKASGFTVEDETGVMAFDNIAIDRKVPDKITIKLNREAIGFVDVSFAWEANPTPAPVFDSATGLPLLSFYKFKVTKRRV